MTPEKFAKMDVENARLSEGVDALLTLTKGSKMIELVARAIYENHQGRKILEWGTLDKFEQEFWYAAARAAIRAMREPNLNMCNTAYDIVCWKRMIDAALKE